MNRSPGFDSPGPARSLRTARAGPTRLAHLRRTPLPASLQSSPSRLQSSGRGRPGIPRLQAAGGAGARRGRHPPAPWFRRSEISHKPGGFDRGGSASALKAPVRGLPGLARSVGPRTAGSPPTRSAPRERVLPGLAPLTVTHSERRDGPNKADRRACCGDRPPPRTLARSLGSLAGASTAPPAVLAGALLRSKC